MTTTAKMVTHSAPASTSVRPAIAKELSRSRWATPQSASTPRVRTPAERLAQEKYKADRLLRRLYWKGESLRSSYKRAIDILRCDVNLQGDVVASEYSFLLGPGTDEASWMQAKKMAENMFKVDFFEFYAVLEKFITLCLAFYGRSVSANRQARNINALRPTANRTPINGSASASGSGTYANGDGWHSFHANLLDEVAKESCPLHSSLGKQDTYIQLHLAKDYRNQWKDADDEENGRQLRKRVIKLEDLNLDQMIRALLGGCLDAFQMLSAEQTIGSNPTTLLTSEMEVDMYDDDDDDDDDNDDDVPYEAVGDAMEIDEEL